jgi:Xaa-Pro aminopeptidase
MAAATLEERMSRAEQERQELEEAQRRAEEARRQAEEAAYLEKEERERRASVNNILLRENVQTSLVNVMSFITSVGSS